jgi:hypothetical protein
MFDALPTRNSAFILPDHSDFPIFRPLKRPYRKKKQASGGDEVLDGMNHISK